MIDNNVVAEILKITSDSRKLTTLFFEITNNCNLNCVHCYLGNKRKEKHQHIPLEKLIDILKEAKQLGVFDIAVTGGEVFTYKYWREFFSVIKQNGFNLVVFTNLVHLTENDISFIKDIGVNSLKISCYGTHQKTYEDTTQTPNSYSKFIENVSLLEKYKIHHFFSNILLSTNESDYKEMIEKYGTRNLELYITDDFQHSGKPLLYRPCSNIWNECHFEVMKNAQIESVPWQKKDANICTAGMARLAILSNGDVIPCINLRVPIGNIYYNNLAELWNGSQLLTTLNKFKIGNFEKCFNCSYKKYLTHICPGSNFNDTGDYYLPSTFKCHMCQKNKEVIESNI